MQVVPQVSLQHPQAQPPVQLQGPSSPQGSRPAPSSPSRPSRSAAQAASRAITSQMEAESDDLGVKELAVPDVQEPEFEAAGEFEAPSSPKRRGRPRGELACFWQGHPTVALQALHSKGISSVLDHPRTLRLQLQQACFVHPTQGLTKAVKSTEPGQVHSWRV